MKKLFLMILAACLVWTLAACGAPADTTGTPTMPTTTAPAASQPVPTTTAQLVVVPPATVPPTTVPPTTVPPVSTAELVMSYEAGPSSLLGTNATEGYRLDFTYASGYRSGSVVLTLDQLQVSGTFTTDENYNINYIEFWDDGAQVVFETTFDDAHRKLSAKSYVVQNGTTDVLYEEILRYDDRGNKVYTMKETMGQLRWIYEWEYNDANQLILERNSVDGGGTQFSSTITYTYDAQHRLTAMCYYEQEQLVTQLDFTHVTQGEYTHCVSEADGQKITMVLDAQGRTVRMEVYYGEELYGWDEMHYDDRGNLLQVTLWSSTTGQEIVTSYTYTESDRLICQTNTTNGVQTLLSRTEFITVEIPQ